MSMTNKYPGICASKSHRTDPETGEVMPLSDYRQQPDAVKVPAEAGSYVRGMVFCADCTAAFVKRRKDGAAKRAAERAAKAQAKVQAKVTAAAEAVQANEQAVETVFSHPEGTEIVLIDSSDKPSIARGDAVADCIVPATVAETVVPDVIEKPKHKPFTEGVEGLDSLFG